MERTTGYYNTFVVKIWCAEGVMRGRIEHVGTRERRYFMSLDKLADFIMSRLCPPANDFGILDKIRGSWTLLSEDFGDMSSDE